MLRAYRAALIPISLSVAYGIWCLWQVRGGDPLLDPRMHNVILTGLGVATLLLWPRHLNRIARLETQMRVLNRQLAAIVQPLTVQAEQNAFAVGVIQGQLTTINTKVDAAVARLDELVSDAYTDGLAARQMRDWNEPPTRPISPQVNGSRNVGHS